jgi:hypothetical protein
LYRATRPTLEVDLRHDKKKHLLVIDDELDFGAMVGTVGERLGHEVTVTARAKDFQAAFI